MKSVVSSTLVAMLLLTNIPSASALMYTELSNSTSRSRCDQLAGREKSRCTFINNRIERLRTRQAESAVIRTNTLRDRRQILDNRPRTDIRRIGSYDLERLRTHNRDGGNARRMIRLRDETARSACDSLEGTEKYMCIRKQSRLSSRGQTR